MVLKGGGTHGRWHGRWYSLNHIEFYSRTLDCNFFSVNFEWLVWTVKSYYLIGAIVCFLQFLGMFSTNRFGLLGLSCFRYLQNFITF